jgi:hypothetical protein
MDRALHGRAVVDGFVGFAIDGGHAGALPGIFGEAPRIAAVAG